MFAVQSSSLCARSQTTTLRTNKAQKKIQRCQAVRVVVVSSSSFCRRLSARKKTQEKLGLSLFLGRSSNLCFGLFFPSVFLPLHSFSRGYLPALSVLSLSLSDYHRSKSTRSLSKRWCVLFSMIRFCFFLLSRALDFVRICLSKVCVCASERAFSFNRACFLDDWADFLSLYFLSLSLSRTRETHAVLSSLSLSLSILASDTSRNLSRKKP